MLTKQTIPALALRKILNNFDLGSIREVEPLATSGNIAYVVKSSRGRYVLRLSPSGFKWRSKQEILAELELVNYLLEQEFPVARPIAKKNGDFVIGWKNHFGYLKEFIGGRVKLAPAIKDIKKFGTKLALFHGLIKDYKTKHQRNYVWGPRETKKEFRQSKNKILKSKFRNRNGFAKRMEEELGSLCFSANLPSGSIHEDLGRRHVIWHQDKMVGFIDFDRFYYGPLVLDLGQACRGWCFVNNWKGWSNKNFQALINGYEKKRKLTKLEKRYLIDAIKFAVLERSLAFCWRYIEVTQDLADESYAWHSIQDNGLLAMIDRNKDPIKAVLG